MCRCPARQAKLGRVAHSCTRARAHRYPLGFSDDPEESINKENFRPAAMPFASTVERFDSLKEARRLPGPGYYLENENSLVQSLSKKVG